ncbi:ABC transporter substrate-binding protein [Paenibacillus physcomitrellae]|uniref:ABC transporter substrate-binding protein n=1 Tax=Paenibacillus physcomitrellae TaxID=1619311 RepID=A0ABQ1FTM4_9BACL|nr:ABC transporter substrate-binding protein [Paenibacillus physcomitrellae]GGA30348.1 ABC transporter substrate-binding protein [Paenibacillus physcomitrellae]
MKKILAIAAAASLLVALTACGSDKGASSGASGANAETDTGPITLTWFDKNTGDAFNNPVAKAITEKTGVTIEVQQPTGNPAEKLNLMLASNDLPDVVMLDRGSDIMNKYISSGAIIPLNDLIDKYAPHIKEMYGDTLKKTRSEDGKNYYFANWYGLEQYPVFGFMMRMDLMKELGVGDKVNNGEPFTAQEFEDLLVKFKEKYPTIDGKESIPMTLNGENIGSVTGTFKGMFGIMPYYEENGELKKDIRDPKYLEMVKYLNSLYQKGLLDKEWATLKTKQYEQKLSTGNVFATAEALWNVGNANTALRATVTDPAQQDDHQFYQYKVLAPGIGPDQTTYGPKSSLGWDGIAITKTNKDPVRTIKLLDFLASEEGQYLLMWGIEGKDWDMKDGKHVPRQETLDAFKKNWDEASRTTGIRKWTWMVKNGPGSDGTPYDLIGRYSSDPVTDLAIKNLADTSFDTAPYDSLGPDGGTPEAIMETKVNDTINKYFLKMALAPSTDQVTDLYNQMIKEVDAAGLPKLEKIYTDNYKKRQELWNS